MAANKIESLQVLRAFAAIAVVAHHSFRAVTVNADPSLNMPTPYLLSNTQFIEIGAFGVDLFFILSGFLMILIAAPYVDGRRPKTDFIVQRLIRVWPMYILATALYLALRIVSRVANGADMPPDASPIRLLSFVFVPSFNEAGLLQPILGVGWTLNYEVFFYLVFLIALIIGGGRLLTAAAIILGVSFSLGTVLPSDTVAHAFLSDPIIFEFLFGAAAARLYLSGHLAKLPPVPLLICGVLLLTALCFWPNESYFRFVLRGIPALLIFLGVLMLNSRVKWPRWCIFLGDASYSVYLFHILIVYQVCSRALQFLVQNGIMVMSAEIAAIAAIAVSIVAGSAIHQAIEKPVTTYLHTRAKRRMQEKSATS